MESELLTPTQVELMFKISDFMEQLSEEELKKIHEQLDEIDLSEEELLIIKEEQDRLNREREKREEAEAYIKSCDRRFNNIIKSTYIHGFDVGETIVN